EGYMRDMEELKRSRAGAPGGAAPAKPPATVAPAAAPPAAAPAPRTTQPTQPTIDLARSAPPPAPAREEPPPIYERWRFWAASAGVVGAGLGVAAAAGAFTHYDDAGCPVGFKCH